MTEGAGGFADWASFLVLGCYDGLKEGGGLRLVGEVDVTFPARTECLTGWVVCVSGAKGGYWPGVELFLQHILSIILGLS